MEENKSSELEASPVFKKRLLEENLDLLIGRTRYALWAACVVYPGFWFLDRITAPEHHSLFLAIRLGVVLSYAITLVLYQTPFGRKIATHLSVMVVYFSALGIELMIPHIGGFESSYYIGILMAFFVAGLFMPWNVKATIVCGVLIILSYYSLNLATVDFFNINWAAIMPPTFFMSGSFLFTIWANREKEITRRKDLVQRMQLEQAADDLKAMDEAKTRFFSNVSHELRSPLTMILSPLDNLIEQAPSEEARSHLEAMESNARRLLRQVNSLLDFAKMDAGKLKCEFSRGNIGEMLLALVKGAKPLAERRNITLATENLEKIPNSAFDENKIETVAANLLSNAIKFTPENGTITIRAQATDKMITFEVSDTGCGIPEDQLESVFERFIQVDDALTRKTGGGTGLGLSMVKELTEMHRGRVHAESELNVGTTFRVELPIEIDDDAVTRRQSVGRRKSDQMADKRTKSMLALHYDKKTSTRTLLSDVAAQRLEIQARRDAPETVQGPENAPVLLLVEDNIDLRNFVGRSLAKTYRVHTAVDGVDGLEAANRIKPDLIVTDVMMPRMDGYQLTEKLRQDEAFNRVPIIIVTAEFGTEKIVRGLNVGASDFVQKPFEMRELESRIAAHLRTIKLEQDLEDRDTRLSAIGKMTSSIVHDLRNPLHVIMGYAQLAQDELEDSEGDSLLNDHLETVISESKQLAVMIAELLDFARGQISKLNLESIPIKPFIESTLKLLQNDLTQRKIELETHFEVDDTVKLMIDRLRTRRVFENLIKNAKEALLSEIIDNKQKHISVRITQDSEGVLIRIADNGPGIPDEIAETLFEPFATSGKESGTGLGLAIARSLLRAQGGDISIEENPGREGAVFMLRFPFDVPSIYEMEPAKSA